VHSLRTREEGEFLALFVVFSLQGKGSFYVAISSTGTQGTADQRLSKWMPSGWINSYGNGGGPKVAAILK